MRSPTRRASGGGYSSAFSSPSFEPVNFERTARANLASGPRAASGRLDSRAASISSCVLTSGSDFFECSLALATCRLWRLASRLSIVPSTTRLRARRRGAADNLEWSYYSVFRKPSRLDPAPLRFAGTAIRAAILLQELLVLKLMTKVFPLLLLVCNAGSAICYAMAGDFRRALYWAASSICIGAISF